MSTIEISLIPKEEFHECPITSIPTPAQSYWCFRDTLDLIEDPQKRATIFLDWLETFALENESEFRVFLKYRMGLVKDALEYLALVSPADADELYRGFTSTLISYCHDGQLWNNVLDSILQLAQDEMPKSASNLVIFHMALEQL